MTALILTTIAIAILSAWYDKVRIAGGHEILHVPRWVIRAALVSIAALLFGHPWMALGLWGLFSAVFRYSLNRWRGKDWRYIGPRLAFRTTKDSWYDGVFHLVAQSCMEFYQRRIKLDKARRIWIAYDPIPGTLAYIVEVVAFAVVAYICG